MIQPGYGRGPDDRARRPGGHARGVLVCGEWRQRHTDAAGVRGAAAANRRRLGGGVRCGHSGAAAVRRLPRHAARLLLGRHQRCGCLAHAVCEHHQTCGSCSDPPVDLRHQAHPCGRLSAHRSDGALCPFHASATIAILAPAVSPALIGRGIQRRLPGRVQCVGILHLA